MLSGYKPRRGKKVFVSLMCTSEDEVPWRLLIFREKGGGRKTVYFSVSV